MLNKIADSQNRKKGPFLTIAVAVYCVEEGLLQRCLESLTGSRYADDIEILLVDDGSTDRCPAILDEFASAHAGIKVIHTPNQGLSGARNVGLDNAHGTWVMFVDGDDYVLGGFLDRIPTLVRSAQDSDIIFYGYETTWDTTGKVDRTSGAGNLIEAPESFALAKSIVANTEFTHGIKNVMFGSSWGKLFKRAFIEEHGCRFTLGVNKSQDRVFMTGLLSYAPSLAVVDATGYAYVNNASSVTHKYNMGMFAKLEHTYETTVRVVDEHYKGEELRQMHEALMYMRCVFMYNALDATYLCPFGNPHYHHEYGQFKDCVKGFLDCIDGVDTSLIYGVRNKFLVNCLKHRLYAPAYYVSMLMMDIYVRAHVKG